LIDSIIFIGIFLFLLFISSSHYRDGDFFVYEVKIIFVIASFIAAATVTYLT
jgi:hypothetical protein